MSDFLQDPPDWFGYLLLSIIGIGVLGVIFSVAYCDHLEDMKKENTPKTIIVRIEGGDR